MITNTIYSLTYTDFRRLKKTKLFLSHLAINNNSPLLNEQKPVESRLKPFFVNLVKCTRKLIFCSEILTEKVDLQSIQV